MKATRIATLAGAVLLLGVGAAAADSGPAGAQAIPPGSSMAQLLGHSSVDGTNLQSRGTVTGYFGTSQVQHFRCTEAAMDAGRCTLGR